MKTLRWMSGVTKLDKLRNERIRETTKVGEMSNKVQESMSEKRWWMCWGNEGEEDRNEGGWITSGTTCRRETCQWRKRNAGLIGGIS